MLVMRRREGEAILIGDDIEIHILSIGRSKVKIGISAPRSVPVSTREIELVRSENQAAAQVLSDGPDRIARLLRARVPEFPEKSATMADQYSED